MADLSDQYLEIANPFLLIGEIERWLRIAIDRVFTADDLVEHLDPDHDIGGADDLTLGQHQQLFGSPDLWDQFGWDADRSVFITELDRARRTRNEIMHFSPDPLEFARVAQLRAFLTWVKFLVE